MASIPPNQTIYVQNLYEKLPKQGRRTPLSSPMTDSNCVPLSSLVLRELCC
jgi:hypothetical protein